MNLLRDGFHCQFVKYRRLIFLVKKMLDKNKVVNATNESDKKKFLLSNGYKESASQTLPITAFLFYQKLAAQLKYYVRLTIRIEMKRLPNAL